MDHEYSKKLWTLQLYKEFEGICFLRRIKMQKPLIKIMDFSSRLGHWDSSTRTLALATRLILENEWKLVLEILKHEMAHQYVEEILKTSDQHGPAFQKACDVLAVEKWARKAEIHSLTNLEFLVGKSRQEAEEGILRRVQRLLALTQSTNEHEALAAMKKVIELQEKYQLDLMRVARTDEFDSLLIEHKLKRLPAFHSRLASILINYFSVQVVFTTLYDKGRMCVFQAIEILGRHENVKIAEYVYWYLYNTLYMLWLQYQNMSGAKGLSAKLTYYLGVLKGFEEKLHEQKYKGSEVKNQSNEQEKSLIKKEEKLLDRFMKEKYPRLHSKKTYQRSSDRSIFNDGFSKGKTLEIHPGIKPKEGKIHLISSRKETP